MLKKTIKYEDYDGNEREEVHYFNISAAELTELQLSEPGGLAQKLQDVVDAQDFSEILRIFKDLILLSYGKKSLDGKRFIKKENGVRLADEFAETEAYSTLFMEMASDENAAVEFIKGILPKEVATEAETKMLENNK